MRSSASVPSDTFAGLRRVLREGRIPVWMPHRSAADADDVPANWNVTSDSLAAWLARELDASSLWLVKSCAVPVQTPERLAAMGIVDFAFPKFCERVPFAVHVVGIDDRPRLVASLLEETVNAVPTAAS